MLDGGLIEEVDEEEVILDKLVPLLSSLSPRFVGFDVDAIDIGRLIEHEREE
jgi:hypothetical protein